MAASNAPASVAADKLARRGPGLLGRISPSSRIYWVRLLAQNRVALGGGVFLFLMLVIAVVAPVIAPYSPTITQPAVRLQGPSSAHLFGTDDLGRDVLSRTLYGARISLLIGVVVTLASTFIGSVIGLVSAYYDRLDTPLMRVMDGLMAFPAILFAIAIMASLGSSVQNVIIALTVVYTPVLARLVRSMALSIREMTYVEAARAMGVPTGTILRRYIFPNALSPIIVQCTFNVAFAILAAAGLSFLGAGVPPDTPTWGNMLQLGEQLINVAWWVSVFPGIALSLTILALTLLGDGLRDALDPHMRDR